VLQKFEDVLGRASLFARRVNIFQSNKPLAALGVGAEVARKRCKQ
jgi:hypothetical protein